MPRPKKAGLRYFYKSVHELEEIKLMELMQRYGPLGYAVFDVTRSEVYRNGYYLEISLERLACYIVMKIGNRWIKDKSIALQMIEYCADIGLFDKTLLRQSVITSVEIQQNYSEVAARRKIDKSKYWLLGSAENDDYPAEEDYAPENGIIAEEICQNASLIPKKPAIIQQSKEKKKKANESKANGSKANGIAAAKITGCSDENAAAAAAAAATSGIEEAFMAATGRQLRMSDRAAIEEMYIMGADDAIIKGVIRQVAERGIGDISSMKYYIPIVQEAVKIKNRSKEQSSRQHKELYCPETISTEDIEAVLDAEWLKTVSQYGSMAEDKQE